MVDYVCVHDGSIQGFGLRYSSIITDTSQTRKYDLWGQYWPALVFVKRSNKPKNCFIFVVAYEQNWAILLLLLTALV